MKNVGIIMSAAVAATIALASIFAAASSSSQLLPAGTGIGSVLNEQPATMATSSDTDDFIAPEENPPAKQPEEPVEKKKAKPMATIEISFQKPSALDYQRIERGIQKLVNEHRQELSLSPLKTSFDLHAVAGRHSASMSAGGYLKHADPSGFDALDRYRLEGISCSFAITNDGAESLFMSSESILGMAEAEIALLAFRGLVGSAIENPDATQMGAGVSVDGKGRMYATANFC